MPYLQRMTSLDRWTRSFPFSFSCLFSKALVRVFIPSTEEGPMQRLQVLQRHLTSGEVHRLAKHLCMHAFCQGEKRLGQVIAIN